MLCALRSLLFTLVLGLLGANPHGQVRLSRHLPRVEHGSVGRYEVFGERVAFSTATGLFTTRVDGTSAAVQVGTLAPGPWDDSSIDGFWPTPDGNHILYLRTSSSGSYQEFVRTSSDHDASQVLAQISTSAEIYGFTPDSQWFVYRRGEDLWSLPLSGASAPVRLHTQEVWWDVRIGTDSRHVVAVTREPGSALQLSSFAIDGSRPLIKLSANFTNIGAVTEATPDGRSICFTAGTALFGNLLRVALDGSSPPVLLSTTDFGEVRASAFLAGDRVVYLVRDASTGPFGVHSVPIDGSDDPVVVATGVGPFPTAHRGILTPDRTGLVLQSDTYPRVLIGARVDGSVAPVVLGAQATEFSLDSTGQYVVFNASGLAVPPSFRAVPLDGSAAPFALSTGPTLGSFYTHAFDSAGRLLFWSGDGDAHVAALALDAAAQPQALDLVSPLDASPDRVIERTGQRALALVRERDDGYSLRSSPVDGAVGQDLSRATLTTALGSVNSFDLGPSGVWAVYTGDVRLSGCVELFSTNSVEHHRLSPTLQPDEEVTNFSITPDSRHVVFRVFHFGFGNEAVLYVAPMRRESEPLRLSPVGFDVTHFWCAPDSATVFLTGRTSAGVESFAVKLDGSGLTRLPRPIGNVRFSPAGDWLTFDRLWTLPVDLHAAPVQLTSSSLNSAFTPDGSRVIWVEPAAGATPRTLRSQAVDGSGSAVVLSLPSTSSSARIPSYFLTADSRRVVFTHDGDGPYQRLFVNAVSGGALVELHPGPSSSIYIAAISEVRQSVLYSMGESLFEVALSGLQPPRLLLSGARVLPRPSPDTWIFELSPDEATAFVGAEIDGVLGIHRFALDGPGPALRLTSLASSFQLYPDGLHAVLSIDDPYFRSELYSLSTSAPSVPRRISGELAASGEVLAHEMGPFGNYVVYLAAQRISGQYELYAHFMDRPDPWKKSEAPGSSAVLTVP